MKIHDVLLSLGCIPCGHEAQGKVVGVPVRELFERPLNYHWTASGNLGPEQFSDLIVREFSKHRGDHYLALC